MTQPTEVIVHPLVLLSTVDHYNRLNAGVVAGKRVVGVLLGTSLKGTVDVTNSFAIPFEEDPKSPNIFYLDHNFLESMYSMFRKVNARERVVGWYSTGPKIKPNDLQIHQIFRRYCTHPVYCIIEVEPKDLGIPTSSYIVKEETEDESSEPKLTFQHVPSSIGALEAEEIGVEHLLRDVSDTTVSTLSTQVKDKVAALTGLYSRLEEIKAYLNQFTKHLPAVSVVRDCHHAVAKSGHFQEQLHNGAVEQRSHCSADASGKKRTAAAHRKEAARRGISLLDGDRRLQPFWLAIAAAPSASRPLLAQQDAPQLPLLVPMRCDAWCGSK
eukprot:GGOE01026494.1.p1 GENE.GGOE01026494.1~~GGOE01026494.1.p1  ORF type:complete len:343 (+),score=67.24 GGOE01026494.1:53-1030(+)